MLKNYVLTPKNIAENIYVEKTYHIRKVGGGGGSGRAPKKKKRVLVSFPRSATPLVWNFWLHQLGLWSSCGWTRRKVAKTDLNSNILVDFLFRAASGIAAILRTLYIGPDIAKNTEHTEDFWRIILSGSAQSSVAAKFYPYSRTYLFQDVNFFIRIRWYPQVNFIRDLHTPLRGLSGVLLKHSRRNRPDPVVVGMYLTPKLRVLFIGLVLIWAIL